MEDELLDDDAKNDETENATEQSAEEKPQPADSDNNNSAISADLIRGHINTIILRTLYERDKYGYEIMNEIEQKSHGQYTMKQPTLYSALKRLESQGYIKAYWKTDYVTLGGRRKYFKLTELGKEFAEKNQSEWEYSRTVIDSLISDRSFDFSQPAPTAVDFNILKKSVTRARTGNGGKDEDEFYEDEAVETSEELKEEQTSDSNTVGEQVTETAETKDEPEKENSETAQTVASEEVEKTDEPDNELTQEELALQAQLAPIQAEYTQQTSREIVVEPEFLQSQTVQTTENRDSESKTDETQQPSPSQQPECVQQQYVQQPVAPQPEYVQPQYVQQPVAPQPEYVQPQYVQQPVAPQPEYVQPQYVQQPVAPQPEYVQPQYVQQPVAPQPEYVQPQKRMLFMDETPEPQPEEEPTPDTRTEEEKRIAHENYLKLITADEQTEPAEDEIDTDKLIYNNKPEPERDYKTLIHNIYNKAVNNGSATREPVQPQPEPQPVVVQQPQPQPRPEPVKEVAQPTVVYTSYRPTDTVVEKGNTDGLKVNTTTYTSAKVTSAKNTTYNIGMTLFKSSCVVGIIMLLEFMFCLLFKDAMGVSVAYPIVICMLAVAQFAIFGTLALLGYGKNAARPTNNNYISISVILTVILILIICLVALLLNVNVQQAGDIMAKIVVPSLVALSIPLFALSYYLFCKYSK